MKTQDLLMLAGGALLVYMLIPKKAAEAAAPGVSIIGIPTAGEAPLDIGGIFGGMADMFSSLVGAMPTQIVPEINIPEFKWPDITIPEINIPDIPEFIIPTLPDELKIPDIPSLIPDIPSLIEPFDPFAIKLIPDIDIIPPEITIGGRNWGYWLNRYFNPFQRWLPISEWGALPDDIAEQEWEAKGYPKEITPEWYYTQKETGLLPQDVIRIREASSGISSESPTISEEELQLQEVPGR